MSIEYALIRDINDQAWRADLLGKKLNARGRGWVHVNPIPLNPTPGLEVDRVAARGRAAVRRAAARARHPDDDPRHPRPGHRRRLRPARRLDGLSLPRLERVSSPPPRPMVVLPSRPLRGASRAACAGRASRAASAPARRRAASTPRATHRTAHSVRPATAPPEAPLRAGERFVTLRMPTAYTPKAPRRRAPTTTAASCSTRA